MIWGVVRLGCMNLLVCIFFFFFSFFFFSAFFDRSFFHSLMLIFFIIRIPAIVTHKGAAADSGHYIGFVKKSVFYAANAKAKELNSRLVRQFNVLEEFVNRPLPESLESGATQSDPIITSVAASLLTNRSLDPEAAPSLLANSIRVHGNDDSADSNSASGPSKFSTEDLDAEDDENWYKFDDEKVTEFPKEKLATLEGGGEDSSAYVLLYRSKVL